MMNDPVNHPSHYTFGSIEVIDALDAWNLPFCRANAIKYIARAGRKGDQIEDLKKAVWYLNHEIQKLGEKKEPQKSTTWHDETPSDCRDVIMHYMTPSGIMSTCIAFYNAEVGQWYSRDTKFKHDCKVIVWADIPAYIHFNKGE